MKTLKKGKSIKRVSDKDAEQQVKSGWKYCSKQEWREKVRDVKVEKPKKRVPLKWVDVTSRGEAPARSEAGVNCEILFENRSKKPVKLFWIGYGNGALKFYARLAPGATRKQNSYSKNAWLITDDDDQPLGFFLVTEDDSHAVVPGAIR